MCADKIQQITPLSIPVTFLSPLYLLLGITGIRPHPGSLLSIQTLTKFTHSIIHSYHRSLIKLFPQLFTSQYKTVCLELKRTHFLLVRKIQISIRTDKGIDIEVWRSIRPNPQTGSGGLRSICSGNGGQSAPNAEEDFLPPAFLINQREARWWMKRKETKA